MDGGVGGVGVVWRTIAGWWALDWPDDGVTGAELGAPDGDDANVGVVVGVIVVETAGRRSEP